MPPTGAIFWLIYKFATLQNHRFIAEIRFRKFSKNQNDTCAWTPNSVFSNPDDVVVVVAIVV